MDSKLLKITEEDSIQLACQNGRVEKEFLKLFILPILYRNYYMSKKSSYLEESFGTVFPSVQVDLGYKLTPYFLTEI